MDNFINNMTDKLDNIRNDEFKLNNFVYEDKIIEKKNIYENPTEFKKYKHNVIKSKFNEKNKKEDIQNIDILEDDIFNNNIDKDEFKLDIQTLDREKKLFLINNFLERKGIILDELEFKKIEDILDDPDFNIKKYLNISKVYQQINKISFIKKLENGSYIVDLSENKIKKTKKYFIK